MSSSDGPDPAATYADLAAIELDFEEIDSATTAYQHLLSQPAHVRRAALVKRIPSFWPLVFEQAPPDIDQYIQPSDSAVFAACLTDLHVDRFECNADPAAFSKSIPRAGSDSPVDASKFGEPRSLSFRFEFADNEWFTDKVIEKRFWYRRARDGWAGRVSEPVKINWKDGKDLSDGLTDASCALWQAQSKAGLLSDDASDKAKTQENDDKSKALPEYQALMDKVDSSTEGSQSFFSWFGFRGRWVSAQESAAATKEFLLKRGDSAAQQTSEDKTDDDEDSDDDEDLGANEFATEVFPDGEELALAIAEDLWPAAIRYFTEAQEDDGDDEDLSEGSFDAEELEALDAEDMDEGDLNMADIRGLVSEKGKKKTADSNGPPSKKRKT